MQYPFELFSVKTASKEVNFNGSIVHNKGHLARILRCVDPTDSNFNLEIRGSHRRNTEQVSVNMAELTTSKYPFKLHSITPIIGGKASEDNTIIYNNHIIESEEQLRTYFKATSAKAFEIAYFDTSEQKLMRFRMPNDKPTDVSSTYPFRLIAITPIVGGWTASHLRQPYPHSVIKDAEHLNAYLYDSEHDTFEITYCDVNGIKQKSQVVNKADLAVDKKTDTRSYNVGASDYAEHKIQPWDIWLEYDLNPWDADIIKRVLRKKKTDGRRLDYEKIIHICKERIRQLDNEKI